MPPRLLRSRRGALPSPCRIVHTLPVARRIAQQFSCDFPARLGDFLPMARGMIEVQDLHPVLQTGMGFEVPPVRAVAIGQAYHARARRSSFQGVLHFPVELPIECRRGLLRHLCRVGSPKPLPKKVSVLLHSGHRPVDHDGSDLRLSPTVFSRPDARAVAADRNHLRLGGNRPLLLPHCLLVRLPKRLPNIRDPGREPKFNPLISAVLV